MKVTTIACLALAAIAAEASAESSASSPSLSVVRRCLSANARAVAAIPIPPPDLSNLDGAKHKEFMSAHAAAKTAEQAGIRKCMTKDHAEQVGFFSELGNTLGDFGTLKACGLRVAQGVTDSLENNAAGWDSMIVEGKPVGPYFAGHERAREYRAKNGYSLARLRAEGNAFPGVGDEVTQALQDFSQPGILARIDATMLAGTCSRLHMTHSAGLIAELPSHGIAMPKRLYVSPGHAHALLPPGTFL
jgi:hypothetical protein